jgi:hypothetical protein
VYARCAAIASEEYANSSFWIDRKKGKVGGGKRILIKIQ